MHENIVVEKIYNFKIVSIIFHQFKITTRITQKLNSILKEYKLSKRISESELFC
jgi:hypothetical protein